MKFVDVHCHLDYPSFEKDISEVVDRAKKSDVIYMITNGVNAESNRKVLELAKRFECIKAALGIYPIEPLLEELKEAGLKATTFDVDEEIDFIRKQRNKICAIGEVGLDDYSIKGTLDKQKKVFDKMINLAEKINKPIIVHSRKAELECIEMLESSSLKKIVMHCFSGKKKLVKRIADNGWYLSIPTNVVRSDQFQSVVRNVNLSQLFAETDSPYLSPFKDKRNEPAFVVEGVKKIAELKGMDILETSKVMFMNYMRVFG